MANKVQTAAKNSRKQKGSFKKSVTKKTQYQLERESSKKRKKGRISDFS